MLLKMTAAQRFVATALLGPVAPTLATKAALESAWVGLTAGWDWEAALASDHIQDPASRVEVALSPEAARALLVVLPASLEAREQASMLLRAHARGALSAISAALAEEVQP